MRFTRSVPHHDVQPGKRFPWSLVLLGLSLVLTGCEPSGDSGDVAPPARPSQQLEQQTITGLLQLYREAVLAEA